MSMTAQFFLINGLIVFFFILLLISLYRYWSGNK